MGVRIRIGEGEDFAHALRRFSKLVQMVYQRPWGKRYPGHAERPGVLARRKRRLQELNARTRGGELDFGSDYRLKFILRWQVLWRREGRTRGYCRVAPPGARARRRRDLEGQRLREEWLADRE